MVWAVGLVVSRSTEAWVDLAACMRVGGMPFGGMRVGCTLLVLDWLGRVHLLSACQLEGLVGFALAGRRDKLALAVGRIAVDTEGTAGRGCTCYDLRNQKPRLALHKPTNFEVFLQFSRLRPH